MNGKWVESLMNTHMHWGGELSVWKEEFLQACLRCSDLFLSLKGHSTRVRALEGNSMYDDPEEPVLRFYHSSVTSLVR